MPEDRVVIPRGHSSTARTAPVEVDLERILKALQTMDANAADRTREFKIFVFFLPFIWGVIYGLLYLLILAGSRS